MIEAIGYIDGEAVAGHSVHTPGAPHDVRVELATRGVAPTLHDLVFAHASIVDERGVRVPVSGRVVRFEAGDGLEVIGSMQAVSENGFAAVLLRVADPAAGLEITAELR